MRACLCSGPLTCDHVPLRYQYSRKALKHRSIVMHWCNILGFNKLPCSLGWTNPNHWDPSLIKRMAGFYAMRGQKLILVLSPDGTLIFLGTRSKLTASFAHIGTEALRAWDAMHDGPLPLRWKRVRHAYASALRMDFVWLLEMVRL